ncbi:hypothetical protein TcasGA2_TC032167 [Tribolium castaneum]|uniref:Uncharacterized protein n=1 Tax=Tribolium castaneum TaxID=7070 RepID=A0A139WMZ5_TRICA|nr:hypothetical protein TcasGA2_TC032167 [Tribolium castaneum]
MPFDPEKQLKPIFLCLCVWKNNFSRVLIFPVWLFARLQVF